MKRLYNTPEQKQEIKEALDTGSMILILRAFFFPKLARTFLIRLTLVIVTAWVFFRFICIPLVIRGGSMLPTYPEHGFVFCWCPAYWFSSPKRGDIVVMKYGKGVMILKRVVALEGDRVSFTNGVLILNGKPVTEPYIKGPSSWNLPERTVQRGHLYLVGDNRSIPIETHIFGEMHKRYLAGTPLW